MSMSKMVFLPGGGGNCGREAKVLAGSVILYWMWGCSSQLEAFGPKPAAPDECRGAFGAS